MDSPSTKKIISSSAKKQRARKKRRARRSRNSFGSSVTPSNSSWNRGAQQQSRSHSRGDFGGVFNPTQCDWYWQNYSKVMNWQGQHQVAYWRARALASEYQNNMLFNYIDQVQNSPTFNWRSATPDAPTTECFVDQSTTTPFPNQSGEFSSNEDSSLVFEMNEEMISFFEQSARHKKELMLQKEEERKNQLDLLPETTSLLGQRKNHQFTDSIVLFGSATTSIIQRETALQLQFEHFLVNKNPIFWPNIPFNL